MYMEQLTEGLSIQAGIDPISQGAGTVSTPGVDMSKFKRVIFELDVGVMQAGSTVDFNLSVSPDNSSWTLLSGVTPATFTNNAITQLLAAGGNNRKASLEIRADQLAAITSPAKAKFVRANVVVGTAASLISVAVQAAESEQKPAKQYDDASVAQRLAVAGPT